MVDQLNLGEFALEVVDALRAKWPEEISTPAVTFGTDVGEIEIQLENGQMFRLVAHRITEMSID